jgi:DNA polymerase-2
MWLHKEGATEADYEQLAREVSAAAGIDISLEGIYRWILFPPSKMDPRLPTANRYVGWYTNNDIKIRGIEIRRRDTPVFIKRLQGEILKIFGRAMTVRDLEHLIPETLDLVRSTVEQLRAGATDPLELVIRRHVSREADEYAHRTVNAEAARALEEAGIHLAPGEMAEYIMVDATGKRIPEKARPLPLYAFEDGYDIEYYTGLTLKAVETLLFPFGYDVERLQEICAVPQHRPRRQPPAAARQPSLFDPEH